MVSGTKVIGYGSLVATVWLGFKVQSMFKIPPLPTVDRTHYWGPGKAPATSDSSIRPFTVKFTPDMINDLKDRLNKTRFTKPLEHVGFEYGFNQDYLKEIVNFWKNSYDFESREQFFNQFPHFKTNIQGLDMHYIHIKPEAPKGVTVLPMLMLHGWPGSVREFYKIIPMLTTPRKDSEFVFELIVPSLPGFGFSEAASKTGLGTLQISGIMMNLMERIGHKHFYIQGGDWGAITCSAMATMYPDSILGYHSNMPIIYSTKSNIRMLIGSLWPSMFVNKDFIHKVYPVFRVLSESIKESGYFHLQATKPDTVGVGIGDSPAGLAAYILEKFSTATDPSFRKLDDGGLTKKYTLTDLIDNLMIYWITNSATSSARIYAESFNKATLATKIDAIPTTVPMAAAKFPNEIAYMTDAQLKDKYPNLLQSTEMPQGGHFAAFENPELLFEDIISAVKKFEAFHKNNK